MYLKSIICSIICRYMLVYLFLLKFVQNWFMIGVSFYMVWSRFAFRNSRKSLVLGTVLTEEQTCMIFWISNIQEKTRYCS